MCRPSEPFGRLSRFRTTPRRSPKEANFKESPNQYIRHWGFSGSSCKCIQRWGHLTPPWGSSQDSNFGTLYVRAIRQACGLPTDSTDLAFSQSYRNEVRELGAPHPFLGFSHQFSFSRSASVRVGFGPGNFEFWASTESM